MEIQVGNLTSLVKTDNPDILKGLHKKYGFFVPGYQYAISYRKRRWDGKKRYFKLNGTFKTGLLKRVLKDLDTIGCKDPLIKTDIAGLDSKVKKIKGFTYRKYQKDAIKYCLENLRCLVSSPTGSGKTLIMAGIVHSLQTIDPDLKVIILFKEKGVLKQTYDFFKSCALSNVGVNSGEGYIDGNIMLSTVQSIDRILDTHLDDATVLMVDEVHQFGTGETTIAAIESFPNAVYRFGFTATVPQEKSESVNARMTLEGAFGPVFTTRTMEELIDDGSLARPIIQIVHHEDFVDEEQTYLEIYDQAIVNSESRNNKVLSIVNQVYETNKSAKILILVKNIQHIRNLEALIKGVAVVEGDTPLEDRYKVINKFIEAKGNATIIGTKVMQTGISIDEITHMIDARCMKGEIPVIQGLGRGVRKEKGVSVVYYYDFYDTVKYLNKHSKSRLKHYKNLNLEINYVKI
tara:strand:- start:30312 stop:31694 length:1383 start_codon:yes stop_codon:yes gene_type:complete